MPLLSTVDTALMGHLSSAHLGAVGLGAMIFNLIYWNFGFLRMGTTGLTAQAYGAQNWSECGKILGRALSVAVAVALIVWLLMVPLSQLGLSFFRVSPDQTGLVKEYFFIRIWAAPATLASYVVFGWLFGMQNALYPLLLTIVVNVANIILSLILVNQMNMGIAGVAWGTVMAQYVGLLLAGLIFIWKYRRYLGHISKRIFDDAYAIRYFFSINRDLFIRTIFLTFSFAFFYRQSSVAGELILAVNVVLLQLINWMSYGIDGFAYAAESLVGKYKGAQNYVRGNQAIRRVMWWGLGLALLYSLTYGLWSQQIFSLFTDQQGVIASSEPFLWYMILFPLAGFVCYIWDGIFIGLTASITMRNTMLISFAFYLAGFYILQPLLGVHGLWLALLLFLLLRGIIQSVYFYRLGWDIR